MRILGRNVPTAALWALGLLLTPVWLILWIGLAALTLPMMAVAAIWGPDFKDNPNVRGLRSFIESDDD